MCNVNVVCVCDSPLLVLTVSKMQRTLLPVHVEGLPFVVSGRCRRRSFHCWNSMWMTYLSLLAVDVFFYVEPWVYFVHWIHNSFTETHITCHFTSFTQHFANLTHSTQHILQILTDSNTCLSTLKWKTDQSRIKSCFIESLPFQCELFTGRNY
jgi:hypothetical protein